MFIISLFYDLLIGLVIFVVGIVHECSIFEIVVGFIEFITFFVKVVIVVFVVRIFYLDIS